jgi:hypothetical protein
MRTFIRPSRRVLVALCALASLACNAQSAPAVDHHQHLLSPQAAALLNNPRTVPELPPGVAQVLRHHEESWNDPARLAQIYSADAVTLDVDDDAWLHGRDEVAAFLGTRFARPYQITPVAYTGDERRATSHRLGDDRAGSRRRAMADRNGVSELPRTAA